MEALNSTMDDIIATAPIDMMTYAEVHYRFHREFIKNVRQRIARKLLRKAQSQVFAPFPADHEPRNSSKNPGRTLAHHKSSKGARSKKAKSS